MTIQSTHTDIQDRITKYFTEHQHALLKNDPPLVAQRRRDAFDAFKEQGFPTQKLETWKNTDIISVLQEDYKCSPEPESKKVNVETFFKCSIPELDTLMINTLNGYYIYRNDPIKKLKNGVIIGSLAEAKKIYPQLVEQYFGVSANIKTDGMVAMNTAVASDGIFVYIPDNVSMDEAIQVVHINHNEENLLVNIRNLIIVGKSSKITLVHCDDSYTQQAVFSNSVTEVMVGENAEVEHYKLQNLNNSTTLINQMFFTQKANSRVHSSSVTLNGGLIRNYTHVQFTEPGAEANIEGLYLVDKNQHVDNHVFIDHAAPHCVSKELFKGLVDDQATAVFNGHIMVRRNAQKTVAYQNNKNLLLTDKARAIAKPFLEIYADDVKCSHGATVGQLDMEALFYLRTRGIGIDTAKMLLMYAFAAEVIKGIKIEALRNQIDDMIKKRLHGELDICETCVLHCKTKERIVSFPIDLSKI